MKPIQLLCICLLSALSACEGWPSQPYTYNPPTAVPSRTPLIETVTPLILSPAPSAVTPGTITPTASFVTPASTESSPTSTQVTPTETTAPISTQPLSALGISILGCDTGIDLSHGMGEVTNAYVTISNRTSSDVQNVCATLRALDEGRPHPDKTKCLPAIPVGYQVTFKLTVDSTYKAKSPIQVDVTSGDTLLERVGEPACTAIGLLLPGTDDLDVLKPIR